MRAERIAKEADASSDLRGVVPRIGIKEGDSTVKMVAIKFGEVRGG